MTETNRDSKNAHKCKAKNSKNCDLYIWPTSMQAKKKPPKKPQKKPNSCGWSIFYNVEDYGINNKIKFRTILNLKL